MMAVWPISQADVTGITIFGCDAAFSQLICNSYVPGTRGSGTPTRTRYPLTPSSTADNTSAGSPPIVAVTELTLLNGVSGEPSPPAVPASASGSVAPRPRTCRSITSPDCAGEPLLTPLPSRCVACAPPDPSTWLSVKMWGERAVRGSAYASLAPFAVRTRTCTWVPVRSNGTSAVMVSGPTPQSGAFT